MKRWLQIWLAASMVLFVTVVVAQPSSLLDYSFDSTAQQQQFQQLTEQLRCLVCQNESLWDSSAPLAKDLRTEIYSKVKSGQSDEQIKQYLVARYGEFILFKPALQAATYALWVMPFLLLLLAFFVVSFIVWRSGLQKKG